jgi:small subunit ribosomal protein S16
MSVKIRLSRIGKKNAPFYRIVAIDERKKRDGAFLEDLGTYNPNGGSLVTFKQERIDDWIAKGAIATDVVKRLYKKHKKGAQAAVPAQDNQHIKQVRSKKQSSSAQ